MEALAVESTSRGSQSYLTFRLRQSDFGINLSWVNEILQESSTTPVPLTPPWVRGVFSLRGRVLPAIDLGLRLGMGPTEVQKRSCLLVLQVKVDDVAFPVGVLVDEVRSVVELADRQVEPCPTFGAGIKLEFLQGVFQSESSRLLLVDVIRVFREDELLQLALTEQRLRTERERKKSDEVAARSETIASEAPKSGETAGASASAASEGLHLFDEE